MKDKKICLITPGHISSNPRLVKEATALSNAGYRVHLVFTQYMEYLAVEDLSILSSNPTWGYNFLDWTNSSPSSKLTRYFSGLMQKAGKKLYTSIHLSFLYKLAINRHFYWQLNEAKKCKADLYIAHNLGALPVARSAAKAVGALSGFDAEDFHRFETSDDLNDDDVQLKVFIEERYIPGTNHLSAASPLIKKEYEHLFPGTEFTSILNVFPTQEIAANVWAGEKPLDLFWFSQRVGEGRGIEEIIQALALAEGRFRLHLLGAVYPQDKEKFLNLYRQAGLQGSDLIFYPPIAPDKILPFASQFDLGLATETGLPRNRDICLTNKLFTYIQAGLGIIASDTAAQEDFFDTYPGLGTLYKKNDIKTLAFALTHLYRNPDIVNRLKSSSLSLGSSSLNWEKEQELYLNKVKQILVDQT